MRLPLATTLKNRQANTTKDARLLNCVVDSKKRVLKRPSLVGTYEVTTPGAGLGLFVRTTPGAPGVPRTEELVVIAGSTMTTGPGTHVQNPTHVLVAASFSEPPASSPQYTGMGFYTGGNPNPAGSLTPSTLNGNTITAIATFLTYSEGPPPILPAFFVFLNGEVSQNFFTSIAISGGGTFNTSAATTFSSGSGVTNWYWEGSNPFSGGAGTYEIEII